MFFRRKSNIVNIHTVKLKTDKIERRIMRDTKKRIKKDELFDAHSLTLYLKYIDAQYEHLRSEIRNTTTVANYNTVRDNKIASIREGLGFYNTGVATLRRLEEQLRKSAIAAGRADSLTHDSITPPDMSDLQAALKKLTGEPESVSAKPPVESVTPKRVQVSQASRPTRRKIQGVKVQ